MAPHDGGQAFPFYETYYGVTTGNEGMTLRDYFAAHAPDVPADFDWQDGEANTWQRRARWNYAYADAMLAARGGA